jgi:hypothetical protein
MESGRDSDEVVTELGCVGDHMYWRCLHREGSAYGTGDLHVRSRKTCHPSYKVDNTVTERQRVGEQSC